MAKCLPAMDGLQEIENVESPISFLVLSKLPKDGLKGYIQKLKDETEFHRIERLWSKLIATVTDQQVIDKHLTLICNVLCGFLTQARKIQSTKIRDFVFSERVIVESFNSVQRAFHDGQQKPALQLLNSVIALIQAQSDLQSRVTILHRIVRPLLQDVFLGDQIQQVKEACITLRYLLLKTELMNELRSLIANLVLPKNSIWKRRLSQHHIEPDESLVCEKPLNQFILALVFSFRNVETRGAALKLFSLLADSRHEIAVASKLDIKALQIVELYLRRNYTSFDGFAVNIIPMILTHEAQFQLLQAQIAPSSSESDAKTCLYLIVLKVGRLNNYISESELLFCVRNTTSTLEQPANFHDDSYLSFSPLLVAENLEVRIRAYELLIMSPSSNAPIPDGALDCLLCNLKYIYDVVDARYRGEIIGITRRLLKKLQNTSLALRKAESRARSDELAYQDVTSYESFLYRFTTFIQQELAPGIPYQRHILALETLLCTVELAKVVPNILCVDLIKSIANLIIDPYDDVREASTLLLKRFFEINASTVIRVINVEFMLETESLSSKTKRSDHADGLGRLWGFFFGTVVAKIENSRDAKCDFDFIDPSGSLLTRLQEKFSFPQNIDLDLGFPLHGILLALKYILQDRSVVLSNRIDASRMVSICRRVWISVQAQLCVDSPEIEFDGGQGDFHGGPKDLLAYSWRALRDSSLLLQAVLDRFQENEDLYRSIGDLCLEQLQILRHRGAFSTVSQTFVQCCQKVREASEPRMQILLKDWYMVAFCEIENQATRITRRSAGLPAMFISILDPNDSSRFNPAVLELLNKAQQVPPFTKGKDHEQSLPQVHALNCLKDIVINFRFHLVVKPHIGVLIDLAATSLTSQVWAIRNCGLMLLCACLKRLDQQRIDTDILVFQLDNKLETSRNPLKVALDLLSTSEPEFRNPQAILDAKLLPSIASRQFHESSIDRVFPALDLLGRIARKGPQVTWIYQLIELQLKNPVWAVRQYAARLISSYSSATDMFSSLKTVFEDTERISENEIHGKLLTMSYHLQNCVDSLSRLDIESAFREFSGLVLDKRRYFSECCSPYVAQLVLDIVNQGLGSMLFNGIESQALYKRLFSIVALTGSSKRTEHSVCHPQFILSRTYEYLLEVSDIIPGSNVNAEALLKSLLCHPDTSRFVLKGLQKVTRTRTCKPIIDLLVSMISHSDVEDVIAQSMMQLSNYLEVTQSTLDSNQSTAILKKISFSPLCSRDLFNASLRLTADLISRIQFNDGQYSSENQRERICHWLQAVHQAVQDEVELLTRSNAARALSSAGVWFSSNTKILGEDIMLHYLMILFIILNDEDDDIRKIATRLTFLIHSQGTQQSACPGPLAAKDALTEFTLARYRKSTLLPLIAVAHLCGPDGASINILSRTRNALFAMPISEQLKIISLNLGDLFAVERQNLYVDDFDRIERWVHILMQCKMQTIDSELISNASKWLLEGLKELQTVLGTNKKDTGRVCEDQSEESEVLHYKREVCNFDSTGPLGLTYVYEVLSIFLRVIGVAQFILTALLSMPVESTTFAADIRSHMKSLQDLCLRHGAHERINVALVPALAESSPG